MIRSARVRLTAWYAAIAVVMLLLLGGTAFLSMREVLLGAIDRDLAAVAQSTALSVAGDHREPDARRAPQRDGVVVIAVDAAGHVTQNRSWIETEEIEEHAFGTSAVSGRPHAATVHIEDEDLRLYSLPIEGAGGVTGAVIAGMSLESHQRDLRLLASILLLTGGAGTMFAVLGGWVFAGRSLQPIQEAYERQRRFVSDASHEMRSPLAVIRASADLLLREPLSASQQESAEDIRDTAVEAAALVDDLLSLARLGSGRGVVQGSADLSEAVAGVLRQMQPLLDEHQTVVTTALAACVVACPADAVRRMLRALLENVIAHTPAATGVHIDVQSDGGGCVLSVRDTGSGIPEAELARVFEPFYRVDAARTPGTGSGLGLAIVQVLARTYGASVLARNVAPSGLEVQVRFPTA